MEKSAVLSHVQTYGRSNKDANVVAFNLIVLDEYAIISFIHADQCALSSEPLVLNLQRNLEISRVEITRGTALCRDRRGIFCMKTLKGRIGRILRESRFPGEAVLRSFHRLNVLRTVNTHERMHTCITRVRIHSHILRFKGV